MKNWLWSFATVAACTGAAFALSPYLASTDLAMIYLLGVVITASRAGTWPSLAATIMSVAAFDFFFVPPYYTFAVSDARYLVTFAVMFIVSVVISKLTQQTRRQAEESRLKEQRTAALYSMSKELVSERDGKRLETIAVRHISEAFDSDIVILIPDDKGAITFPAVLPGAFPGGVQEQEAAQWAHDHQEPTGLNIPTGPDAKASYFPLTASGGAVGVLGIRPRSGMGWLDAGQIQYLEAFIAQTAIAIERTVLVEQAHQAMMNTETERLRNTLLSSISHDLRTPLTSITGAASTLREHYATLDEQNRTELIQTVQEEASRLNSIIKNILAMTRIESGAIRVSKEWQSLEEIVGVVLNRLNERLKDHPVSVTLPGTLPLVPFDALLLEQVLMNLFENALKYTPTGTPLELAAEESLYTVTVSLADRGPGIRSGDEERIFEKFVRGNTSNGGVGLGLAICRAIITAHGGKIWVENREGGGAVFKFTLSAAGVPPVPDTEIEDD